MEIATGPGSDGWDGRFSDAKTKSDIVPVEANQLSSSPMLYTPTMYENSANAAGPSLPQTAQSDEVVPAYTEFSDYATNEGYVVSAPVIDNNRVDVVSSPTSTIVSPPLPTAVSGPTVLNPPPPTTQDFYAASIRQQTFAAPPAANHYPVPQLPQRSVSESARYAPNPASTLRSSLVNVASQSMMAAIPGSRSLLGVAKAIPTIAVKFRPGLFNSSSSPNVPQTSQSNVPNLYTQAQYYGSQGVNAQFQNPSQVFQQGPPPPMIWHPDNQSQITSPNMAPFSQPQVQPQTLGQSSVPNPAVMAAPGAAHTSTPSQPVPPSAIPGPGHPGYTGYGPSNIPIQQGQAQGQFLTHIQQSQNQGPPQSVQQIPMQQNQLQQPFNYNYQQSAQYVSQQPQSTMPPYSPPPPGGIVPAPYRGNQLPQQQRTFSGMPPRSAPLRGGIIPASYKASRPTSGMPPHSKPPSGGFAPASYSATQAQQVSPPLPLRQQGVPAQQPQHLQQIPAANTLPNSGGYVPTVYAAPQGQQAHYQTQQGQQVNLVPQPGSQPGNYVTASYLQQSPLQQYSQHQQTGSGHSNSNDSVSVAQSASSPPNAQPPAALSYRPPSQPQFAQTQPPTQTSTTTPPPTSAVVPTGYTPVTLSPHGTPSPAHSPAQSPSPQIVNTPQAPQNVQLSQTMSPTNFTQPASGYVPVSFHAQQTAPLPAQQSINAGVVYPQPSSLSGEAVSVSYVSVQPGQPTPSQTIPQVAAVPAHAYPISTPSPQPQTQPQYYTSPPPQVSSPAVQPVSQPSTPGLPSPHGLAQESQVSAQAQIQLQYTGVASQGVYIATTPEGPTVTSQTTQQTTSPGQPQQQQPYSAGGQVSSQQFVAAPYNAQASQSVNPQFAQPQQVVYQYYTPQMSQAPAQQPQNTTSAASQTTGITGSDASSGHKQRKSKFTLSNIANAINLVTSGINLYENVDNSFINPGSYPNAGANSGGGGGGVTINLNAGGGNGDSNDGSESSRLSNATDMVNALNGAVSAFDSLNIGGSNSNINTNGGNVVGTGVTGAVPSGWVQQY